MKIAKEKEFTTYKDSFKYEGAFIINDELFNNVVKLDFFSSLPLIFKIKTSKKIINFSNFNRFLKCYNKKIKHIKEISISNYNNTFCYQDKIELVIKCDYKQKIILFIETNNKDKINIIKKLNNGVLFKNKLWYSFIWKWYLADEIIEKLFELIVAFYGLMFLYKLQFKFNIIGILGLIILSFKLIRDFLFPKLVFKTHSAT